MLSWSLVEVFRNFREACPRGFSYINWCTNVHVSALCCIIQLKYTVTLRAAQTRTNTKTAVSYEKENTSYFAPGACNLTLCNLTMCNLAICNLTLRNLALCNLTSCNLAICNLTICNLTLYNFTLYNLTICNLMLRNLTLCNLTICNLMLRNLTLYNLTICNLMLRNLTLYDLTICNLTLYNLTICKSSETSRDLSFRITWYPTYFMSLVNLIIACQAEACCLIDTGINSCVWLDLLCFLSKRLIIRQLITINGICNHIVKNHKYGIYPKSIPQESCFCTRPYRRTDMTSLSLCTIAMLKPLRKCSEIRVSAIYRYL